MLLLLLPLLQQNRCCASAWHFSLLSNLIRYVQGLYEARGRNRGFTWSGDHISWLKLIFSISLPWSTVQLGDEVFFRVHLPVLQVACYFRGHSLQRPAAMRSIIGETKVRCGVLRNYTHTTHGQWYWGKRVKKEGERGKASRAPECNKVNRRINEQTRRDHCNCKNHEHLSLAGVCLSLSLFDISLVAASSRRSMEKSHDARSVKQRVREGEEKKKVTVNWLSKLEERKRWKRITKEDWVWYQPVK